MNNLLEGNTYIFTDSVYGNFIGTVLKKDKNNIIVKLISARQQIEVTYAYKWITKEENFFKDIPETKEYCYIEIKSFDKKIKLGDTLILSTSNITFSEQV